MEDFIREYDDGSGQFSVEVWRVPGGLDLTVTLPSAEVIPCHYDSKGNLESRLIWAVRAYCVHRDLTMMETKSASLSPKVRQVALRAVGDYLCLY